jgi:tyrosyl-tRNA synthetase
MDLQRKIDIILRDAEEVVTLDELKNLLETGGGKGYLGFEPSGVFHIGWLVWALKFKDLIDAGIKMYLLAATWHAWINDKLGGNKSLIHSSVKHVKAIMDSLGIEGKYELVFAEDLVKHVEYWEKLLRAAKNVSLARVKRALTIMGRRESEGESDFSKLVYPLMQVTDINFLDVDIALGGMDQRRAHMLQRDIAEKLGWKKVIAIHTPLLPSLQGVGRMETTKSSYEMMIEAKMSKSVPSSAILIIDSDEEIRAKLKKAYCPPKIVEGNPILALAKHLIFRGESKRLVIERPSKYGGRLEITSYEELENVYKKGMLHPLDLKNAVADSIIRLVSPIRERILSDPHLKETVYKILSSITR